MRRRSAATPAQHSHNPIVRYFRVLGPGLVTGAADDDPSGITAYSAAGASLGHSMSWMAWVTYPLMAAIQLVCARIGMVSGYGLAGAIRTRYPRPFLYAACAVLLAANVFNIAADLAGMADAVEMVTGLSSHIFVPIFGLVMLVGTVYLRYEVFARYLKWLTAVLFAYIVTAFLARPDWHRTLTATLVPSFVWKREWIATFVGILGTTISPYLFFWQASQQGRGGARDGALDPRGTAGSDRARAERRKDRRERWDVLLERRHVLHHPHHCLDLISVGIARHRNQPSGGRGAAAAGRRMGVPALHGRYHRNRSSLRAHSRRLSLRRGGGALPVAVRPPFAPWTGLAVLRRHRDVVRGGYGLRSLRLEPDSSRLS
jgi:hypothetical protein